MRKEQKNGKFAAFISRLRVLRSRTLNRMGAVVTWVLDLPWDWVLLTAVWLFMRLLGVEIRLSELKERKYDNRSGLPPDSIGVESNHLVEYAERELADAVERRSAIDAKVAGLLKLTSILLPLSVAAVKLAGAGSGGVVPLALLGVSLLLSLGYLDLGRSMRPNIDNEDLSLCPKDFMSQRVTSLVDSARFNENVNDFLADVYRASIRAFVAALIALLVVGATNLDMLDSQSTSNAAAGGSSTFTERPRFSPR